MSHPRGPNASAGRLLSPRLAALGTVLALWLPPLLPFCAGPLRECDHCVALYARLYALVPGAWGGYLVGLALGDSDHALALVAMGALTAALAGLLFWRLRRGGRGARWLLAAVALLSGAQAMGLANVLRA